jgi:hypothetical protein
MLLLPFPNRVFWGGAYSEESQKPALLPTVDGFSFRRGCLSFGSLLMPCFYLYDRALKFN